MEEELSAKKTKRTADRQISKDDDPEGDGEAEGSVAGAFQRASDEVLKTRRIVRPRSRLSLSGAGAQPAAVAANPFRTVVLPSVRPNQDDSKGVVNGTTSGTIAATATALASGSSSGSVSVSSHEKSEESSGAGTAQPPSTPASIAVEETPASARPEKTDEIGGTETEKATGDETSEGEGKVPAKSEESKEGTEGQSAPDSPSVPGSKKQNGVTEGDEERGGIENGTGSSKKAETPSGAFGGVAGSGKIISFGNFGAGSGGSGSFQGASPLGVPSLFGGFGSKPGTAPAAVGAPPLSSSTASVGNPFSSGVPLASLGTVSTSSSCSVAEGDGGGVTKAAKPVVSFGAPAGGGGGFKSFISIASDASKESLWGISPKGKGAEAGAAPGEKKDCEGGSSGLSATKESTKTSLELMDPSEVVNGEESEECMHRTRAKLFRLANKEWAETGIGNMKVLRSAERAVVSKGEGSEVEGGGQEGSEGGKAVSSRLVMRREAGQQVILNIALQEQTRCSTHGEKALMISCFTADGPATYLLKVKTSEDARNLKAAIDALLPGKSG